MATARTIVTRALRRARVLDATETATAEDAAEALAALNDMLHAWPSEGVPCLHQGWTLEQEATLWIPPPAMSARAVDAGEYSGVWDASTNTPTLSATPSVLGAVYKVSVAGSTSLGGVTSWAVGDHVGADTTTWRKGRPLDVIEGALVALLALRLMGDYGKDPDAVLAAGARAGWSQILSIYVRAPQATHDSALVAVRPGYWTADDA